MKRSNSEILAQVKNLISDKKDQNSKGSKDIKDSNDDVIKVDEKFDSIDNEIKKIDNEINKWIEINAERITKEIIQKEVKKIFK